MRREHDLVGEREVPEGVYWGVHTLRATENFPITGHPLSSNPLFVRALAEVKLACVRANADLGLLEPELATVIEAACHEILEGRHVDQFVVDVIQGGAGTSSNMNANDVIANRANELLGGQLGAYARVHPNDHVNLNQSTNDVYPTAARIATIRGLARLRESLSRLVDALGRKSVEFAEELKVGRTQLQDAVPMTLGQEFGAFAVTLHEEQQRIADAERLLLEINLGATAIGTEINAPKGYSERVRFHLAAVTGLDVVTSSNLIEATADVGAFVNASGVIRRSAIKLSKICNDLRLLASGPQAGFHEIDLPSAQSGSSIMPGKVNPVIPEVVNQVAFEVLGNDVTISFAAEAGQLQLNAFEPIIVHSLHKSLRHLANACDVLAQKCIVGITANTDRIAGFVNSSVGIATALNPVLGYTVATQVAQEALLTGESVQAIVMRRKLLDADTLTALLRPERLANSRVRQQASSQ